MPELIVFYFRRGGNYVNGHLWARGYYDSTVGLQEKALRNDIQEQEKQDQIEDKVSTKEY